MLTWEQMLEPLIRGVSVGPREDGCRLVKTVSPVLAGGRKEGSKQEGTTSRILMVVIKYSNYELFRGLIYPYPRRLQVATCWVP